MTPYQPLNCALYDYLEVACMGGYRLEVELLDGRRFQARAVTTRTSAQKQEFLLFEPGTEPAQVRLDQLLAITPLDDGAPFGRVLLNGGSCSI